MMSLNYGMGDNFHILQKGIIQVKPGEPAVQLRVMMVFLLTFLYIFMVLLIFFFLFRLAKKLEKQAKIGTSI